MKESDLFKLFPSEYRDLVLRYKKTLLQIFQEYQVVIFMARKAVCFYKSLVIGGFINKPKNCEVFSSRVLTYDITKGFKGKEVIVVDDVMIKGDSLNNALKILSNSNIKADVYIMARPIIEGKDVLRSVNIVDTFAEITMEDTYQLSKHIADFIEACMCPYNIDQPIFNFRHFDEQMVMSLVDKHNLMDISSSLQQKYGIKSYSLEIPNTYLTNSALKDYVDLCKIRFFHGKYSNKTVFLAVPFVLIDEMKSSELEAAFSHYDNEQIRHYIYNENNRIVHENQLKILHYVLAAQLMDAFIQANGINGSHRLNSNDDFVFSKDVLQMINSAENPFDFSGANIINDISYDYEFRQNEYFDLAFDYLYSDKMKYVEYYNSADEVIKSELLILQNLKDYIASITGRTLDTLLFSNAIDALIDKGLIIPSIVHGINATIIRAYKCGEVYALNKEHFQLFTYALGEYLRGIGHDRLQKTEFEKLCVLFFREAVQGDILKYGEAVGNEDEYSICYSKFGPRVSTSKPIYSADETSTLASRLLNLKLIDSEDVVIETQEQADEVVDNIKPSDNTKQSDSFKQPSYYTVFEIEEDEIKNQAWKDSAKDFSKKYKLLYRALFNGDGEEILFDEVRDMHMRTYIEFLIMLSIGLSKKEQLLSLLAEIYLFDSIDVNGNIYQTLIHYGRVLDGLISGMWKYMCYVQPVHPLRKVYENLEADAATEHLSVFIGDIFKYNRDIDKNEYIQPMIDEVGKLIFSIVYSIWFMYKKYHIHYHVRGKVVDLPTKNPREFHYRYLKDLQKIIKDQIQSNTTEQDIQILRSLKLDSQRLIERYNAEIAKGKKHVKKDDNSTAGVTINGNVEKLTHFENGGAQINGN